jgi:septal ring factor EnvC (AmiA/AmiB activator)
MADNKPSTGEDELSKAVWHYIGVGVLWLSLILSGLAFERLGLTSGFLTSVIPGEVGGLRAKNEELETNRRNVMDENQRLSGLIGRERQTQEALDICQQEKKKIEEELRQAKTSEQ